MNENEKPKYTLAQTAQILARACRILQKAWPGFFSLSILTSAINALKPLIALFFSAQIINELTGERDVQLIIIYVAITVCSVFILSVVNAFLSKRLNVRNEYNYSKLEFLYVKRYMEMDYQHIEDHQVNQVLADIRARSNGNNLGLLRFMWAVPELTGQLVTLIASLILLAGMFTASGAYTNNWATSPAATIVLAVLAALSVLTPLFIRKWQKEALDMVERENPKANTMFGFYSEYKDVKNAAKDIRLYNQTGTLESIFKKRLNYDMWIWFFKRLAVTNSVSGAVNALTGCAVYMFIGLRALYGMYAIGSVVQYVGAVTNIINTLSGITSSFSMLLNNQIYMQNIYRFLDLNDPPSRGVNKPDASDINIVFENVSLKYPGTENYALRNVSLEFKRGKRLAVVGMNGGGKTTMVKLLCRLYQPTEGVIRLNGEDIQNFSQEEYTRLFNVVFQDFKLFSLSLGANVATAEDFDRKKLEAALSAAGFGEKYASLEKGLDTMMGKDCDKTGVSFSGGEEQKVAIARAIYRDAPFVIFDEPTAALDPISEYEVYTKLNEIVGEKTAVFISHRLSSCRFCDDIAVFHQGALIQRGTHDALLAEAGGKYAELWNAQAQHYTE
jgi:ATP-binding cassette subfamily B protein